ncbi:MAG: 16S rRNA (cytosine(1402)-N(4))-methyltransferase RsmH, partial [Pseudomonadales bacterium]
TVLLTEAVDALVWNVDGTYIDGTFGRGGHAREILARLSKKGRLFGIDKDPQAVQAGQELAASESRFEMYSGSFTEMKQQLEQQGIHGDIAGILLDLGVSSPQIDQPERGFSFTNDGPLDMRMNPATGISAEQWVNSATSEEIAGVLKTYGEERFARRIANAICAARDEQDITTTAQLAAIIKQAHPRWEPKRHPATKSFQAIRIFINDELADLRKMLGQALDLLMLSGRLVVISFHSLEDRIVKRFMRSASDDDTAHAPAYIPLQNAVASGPALRPLGKRIKPTQSEIERNIRARSAVMRVAEKRT